MLSDSLYPELDSSAVELDSLLNDTLPQSEMANSITDMVDYNAIDSMPIMLDSGIVEMYNQAIVTYGDIKLEAGYIRYNMHTSEVLALGIPDSTGQMSQKPVFSEKNSNYEANSIRYNFNSKQAFVKEVITEQEGGFLHSAETKMHADKHIHIKNGVFTTCDAPHPHFGIVITKGISMPDDRIVSGPAYLVLEDVPLPIGIPFGFFPNTIEKSSGILIPQYGEENNRGFYLRDGGYYFALNEYFDLRITGDAYSNGTWGIRAGSNYKVRYKFNGNLNLQFFRNATSYRQLGDYSTSKDYRISWSHSQAREANPNRTFRASVNLSSSSYDQQHTTNYNNLTRNTKQSSISYSKSWPNSPFNLSASLNHSQNSNTESVDMTLPKVSFNMSRINPFERKKRVGPKKWYEDVQLSYSSLLENKIKTTDSLIFTKEVFSGMTNGFRHEVPLSLNIKPFKKSTVLQTMTITPNVSYKGMIYTTFTEKTLEYEETLEDGVTYYNPVVTDTLINKLSYAHSYLPRISTSLSPKIYGMYNFSGGGRVEAVRHMISPTASFSYVPDMTAIQPNYYRNVYDSINDELLTTYSIYEDQIYGTPTFNGASGSLNFSLKNTVEAKVRSKNDTIDKVEKIKLLDNLNLSSSYNMFNRDSLAPSWSTVSMTASTKVKVFNQNVNLNFRSTLDPFAYSDTRSRVNETWFKQTGKLARLTNASFSTGIRFKSKSDKEGEEDDDDLDLDPINISENPMDDPNRLEEGYSSDPNDYYGDYVDFDIPWSIRLDYSFNYTKPTYESRIVQTVRASGDLSLTPKWKINVSTGYDIANKQFTTTNFSIHRDLHCWQMRISVVPFGKYQSYNFQINAKSSILSDLKYNKRKAWTDNF